MKLDESVEASAAPTAAVAWYIYNGTFFFTVTLFSPENRYRLGDLFFIVLSRFSVLGPLFQKRADLNVPPTFGSDSFWCRVGSSFGSVFFMFFLNFFREPRQPCT